MRITKNLGARIASLAGTTMVGLALALPAQAEVILAYDGSNSPDGLAASESMVGLVPVDLTRGEGLSAGSGNTYNSSGWTDEATDYLEWGWSNSTPLDLTDLDIRYDRSASGPSMIDIHLAINGGTFESIFTDPSVATAGEDAMDVDLTGFNSVTSATFRLFGSGASSGGGTFDIEPFSGVTPARGISVSGVSAVPEPSSFYLLAVAGLGLMVARRWRAS